MKFNYFHLLLCFFLSTTSFAQGAYENKELKIFDSQIKFVGHQDDLTHYFQWVKKSVPRTKGSAQKDQLVTSMNLLSFNSASGDIETTPLSIPTFSAEQKIEFRGIACQGNNIFELYSLIVNESLTFGVVKRSLESLEVEKIVSPFNATPKSERFLHFPRIIADPTGFYLLSKPPYGYGNAYTYLMRFDNDLNLIYEADLTVSMQNRWVKYYQYNSYTGDIFLKCKNDDTKKIDYVIHYTPEGKTGSFDLPVTEGEKILNSVYSYNKEEKTYSFFAFGTNLYNGPKDYSGVAYVYKEFDQNEVLRTEYKNYKRDEILSDPVLKNFISQSSPKYTFSSTDNFGKISLEQNSVNILPNGDFLLMVKNLKEAKKVKDLKAPINSCNLIVCVGKDGKEKWKKVLPLAPDTSPYRNTISTDNTLTMILPVNKDLYNEKGELLEYQSGTRDHIMAFQFDLETGHYENPVFIPFPERSIPCKHIKHYNPENKHFVLGLEPRSFMPPHNAKFVPINLEK